MIDRQIQSHFHLFAKCVVTVVYITFCKQMEMGLYLPVYHRSFRDWRLSRFVTKLFISGHNKFVITLGQGDMIISGHNPYVFALGQWYMIISGHKFV